MNVPYLDLGRTRDRIAPELDRRWRKILAETSFILGAEVREFESAFAAYLEVAECVGLGNGTDALILALQALGLKPGDEVIVPAFSFFATAEAVAYLGGVPVFADVDAATFNLDARDAAARVTARTVGVIGVHLYGLPFDVAAIQALCDKHHLWLVEDAAQAHGARYRGKPVGGFGQLAAWSFYPTKNLGCFGDGGAATGNDRDLVGKVRLLGNHGQTSRYHHVAVGSNSRLDSLQAAVLNCRLPLLEADNTRRREIAAHYRRRLGALSGLSLVPEVADTLPVYHQLTIRTAERDRLMKSLAEQRVGSSVHYPQALHLLPALATSAAPGDLPVATAAGDQVLCLPVFPELSDVEVERVCDAVEKFFTEAG